MRPPGRALRPGGSTPPVPATAPCGGMARLRAGGGRPCPAGAIGLATGMAVGRAFSPSTAADVCVPALETAKGRGCAAGGAIFHPDRGSQCAGPLLAGRAREDDVRPSVGRTGCCRDDAVAESLWASLKNEMHRRRTSAARDEAKFACVEWIEGFHDRRRPHSSIGYRHPADVMADFKRRMEEGSDFLAA